MGNESSLLAPIVAVTTGLIGASFIESQKAKKKAKQESDRLRTENDIAAGKLKEQQDKQKKDVYRASSVRYAASQAGMNTNRSGTILTSPLGLTNEPSSGQKTLLGQ